MKDQRTRRRTRVRSTRRKTARHKTARRQRPRTHRKRPMNQRQSLQRTKRRRHRTKRNVPMQDGGMFKSKKSKNKIDEAKAEAMERLGQVSEATSRLGQKVEDSRLGKGVAGAYRVMSDLVHRGRDVVTTREPVFFGSDDIVWNVTEVSDPANKKLGGTPGEGVATPAEVSDPENIYSNNKLGGTSGKGVATRAEEPNVKSLLDGLSKETTIYGHGFFWKRAEGRNKWSRRLLIVTGSGIYYYKRIGGRPAGTIPLPSRISLPTSADRERETFGNNLHIKNYEALMQGLSDKTITAASSEAKDKRTIEEIDNTMRGLIKEVNDKNFGRLMPTGESIPQISMSLCCMMLVLPGGSISGWVRGDRIRDPYRIVAQNETAMKNLLFAIWKASKISENNFFIDGEPTVGRE